MTHQEHRHQAPASVNCAVLTFSDSRTEEDDESGRLLRQKLEDAGHKVTDYGVLKDDAAVISRKISGQLDVEELDIEV